MMNIQPLQAINNIDDDILDELLASFDSAKNAPGPLGEKTHEMETRSPAGGSHCDDGADRIGGRFNLRRVVGFQGAPSRQCAAPFDGSPT